MQWDLRRVVVLSVLSASVAGSDARAQAQPKKPVARPSAASPAAAAPAANDARMRALLKAWEAKSAELKSLDVDISRLDTNPAWGDVEEYKGRAILKSPDRAWLNFEKVERDKPTKKLLKVIPHERIVCTGAEVWQYRSDTKQIFIFPLNKQDQKRALEEGPLPFLFNMKAAEAEARYLMSIVSENKDYYQISVTPRLKVDQEAFSKAFLQLRIPSYLPDRIYLVSPDGKSSKDFKLSNVKRNTVGVEMEENFKGKPLGKPWTIVRDPVGDGPAGAKPQQGLGNRQPPAAKALQRR